MLAEGRALVHKSNILRRFDNRRPDVHHDPVNSVTRATVLLVGAMLLTWQTVILAVPHNHADSAVPQEELACSASHPLSPTSHLHGAGLVLSPHPCLACLAESTVADEPASENIPAATNCEPVVGASVEGHRPLHLARLPLSRAPPLAA